MVRYEAGSWSTWRMVCMDKLHTNNGHKFMDTALLVFVTTFTIHLNAQVICMDMELFGDYAWRE